MYKGQIRHPGAARHQQAIQSNHIVWHGVEHVCQHLHVKHKDQLLGTVREKHLQFSQLLTEGLRLLKTPLLAAMIPRLFCHTWILLTGSSSPKVSPNMGGCCLLAPSISTSPRTPIPAPYNLETMPKSMTWLNSLCTQHRGPFLRLHCTLSWELWDTAMPPFPRKNSSSRDTRFLLISSSLCPLTALGPVPMQQPGLQKNVSIKYYRTKHSIPSSAMLFVLTALFQECVTGDRNAMWA